MKDTPRRMPTWLQPKVELDKTFWDVVYYRYSIFNEDDPDFEEHVVATKSDKHTHQVPIICHLGVDWCARVAAETEDEAIERFWRECDMYRENLYR